MFPSNMGPYLLFTLFLQSCYSRWGKKMAHMNCTEFLISSSAGPEKKIKCVFVYVILDKYYKRLIPLHMQISSPYY